MSGKKISAGVVHDLPSDLHEALVADDATLELWEGFTPLARNEWICWVEEARKPETRLRRIRRVREELGEGKRRPCCWAGCLHRVKDGRAG